jgi:hypothetical protein
VRPGEDARPGDGGADAPDSAGAVCGNEICEAGESALTCRKDCEATGPLLCLATDCKSALDACFDVPSCVTAAACILDCPDQACRDACQDGLVGVTKFVVEGLATCGEGADCFAGAGACPGACGDFVEGAPCQCQKDCAIFNDCCEDFAATCAGGPTCAEEKCPDQLAACQALPDCKAGLACAAACTTSACAIACVSGKGQAVSTAFLALRQCVGAECAPVAPECGDGVCGDGETTATCPADCPASGPECGDGTCEGPETPATCPADCKTSTPTCGDGICDAGETLVNCFGDCFSNPCGDGKCETWEQSFCPADCGQPPPPCGNGTCGQGENSDNCPADCPPGPATCGSGTCDVDETPNNCAEDCAPTTGAELVACLSDACSKQAADCGASPPCAGVLDCVAACTVPDFKCLQDCAGSVLFQSEVTALATCGFEAGCVPAGP